MESIICSQKQFEKKMQKKTYENHFRSNNYDVCTAAVHYMLDVVDLENI
jgi:hypothetical protein